MQYCLFHIRNISRIRPCLSIDSAKTIVHVLVTPRLDYCDALSSLWPTWLSYPKTTTMLVITCKRKFDHVTPFFELHWLPVRQRIAFKILLNTFKASMLLLQRTLLSLSVLMLQGELLGLLTKFCWSSQRTSLTDLRAFSVCEPFLWNSLPFEIKCNASVRIFKAESKTYLFRQAYIY